MKRLKKLKELLEKGADINSIKKEFKLIYPDLVYGTLPFFFSGEEREEFYKKGALVIKKDSPLVSEALKRICESKDVREGYEPLLKITDHIYKEVFESMFRAHTVATDVITNDLIPGYELHNGTWQTCNDGILYYAALPA